MAGASCPRGGSTWLGAVVLVAVVVGGCSGAPAPVASPPAAVTSPPGEVTSRYSTVAELRAALLAHYEKARTARYQTSSPNGRPVQTGVVQWRPTKASDGSATFPATPTSGEVQARIVTVDGMTYFWSSDEPADKPWKLVGPAQYDSSRLPEWPGLETQGFAEVIEGQHVDGAPVIGYPWQLETGSTITYFMDANGTLRKVVTRTEAGGEVTETYSDFGIPVDIRPPPADQIQPAA